MDIKTKRFLQGWCLAVMLGIGSCIYLSDLQHKEAIARAEASKLDCENKGGIFYDTKNCGKWRRDPCSITVSVCLLPVPPTPPRKVEWTL